MENDFEKSYREKNRQVKNYGVLLGERPGDYRAGAKVGALPYIIRNESGDWEPKLPLEENQSNDGGDSMSCVTFAELNEIETQEKSLAEVEPNYSDRWIAKMAETAREGAYLYQIADAIRKYGLVKESSYPAPPLPWTWDEYHKEIPEPLLSQLKAEGQRWLEKWDVKYESIDFNKESLMRHLKMAPLAVVIPGHAILNFRTTAQVIHYFDTYPPYKKTTPGVIQAMKVMLYPKEQALDPDTLLVDLKFGDKGSQVLRLKRALTRLGWFSNEGDIYDDNLVKVVFNYQLANLNRYGWNWWWHFFYYRGKLVDETTREGINNNLKFRK